MRKPTICIYENKDANQLRGNREADHRLCFRYMDSTIPLLLKSEISSFCPASVTAQPDLCWTFSETTLLVSSQVGSFHYLCRNTGFLASISFNSSVTESSLLTYFSTYSDHLSTSTGSSEGSCSVSSSSIVSRHSCLYCKYIYLTINQYRHGSWINETFLAVL